MVTYRVGESGATVFDAEGHPVLTLDAGTTIVPGTIETDDSPARRHFAAEAKRRGTYEDKRIRPPEDKSGDMSPSAQGDMSPLGDEP